MQQRTGRVGPAGPRGTLADPLDPPAAGLCPCRVAPRWESRKLDVPGSISRGCPLLLASTSE